MLVILTILVICYGLVYMFFHKWLWWLLAATILVGVWNLTKFLFANTLFKVILGIFILLVVIGMVGQWTDAHAKSHQKSSK